MLVLAWRGEARSDAERNGNGRGIRPQAVFGPGLDPSGTRARASWPLLHWIGIGSRRSQTAAAAEAPKSALGVRAARGTNGYHTFGPHHSFVLSRSVTRVFEPPLGWSYAHVMKAALTKGRCLRHDSPHGCHFCNGYKLRPDILSAGVTNHTFAVFTTQHDSYSKKARNMLTDTTRLCV